VDDAIAVMGAAGVDGAAFVPTDRCDNPGLLSAMEAAIAGGYRGRLWFFAWPRPAPIDAASAVADLAWIRAHARQVAGVKIHPSLHRARITDDAFAPVLAVAEELGLVVLVHCGRWQEMASYRFAVEAAQRHPRAKFLLAHAGGDTPPNATAAARLVADTGVANVWFEFSGLREYWVIERNVALLGAERYLMGSDYNLAHPLMYIGAVRGMALSEPERARILGGNAVDLLGPPLDAPGGP
jgi:predicted TIM-barrel fold metal-dependent hydrolase